MEPTVYENFVASRLAQKSRWAAKFEERPQELAVGRTSTTFCALCTNGTPVRPLVVVGVIFSDVLRVSQVPYEPFTHRQEEQQIIVSLSSLNQLVSELACLHELQIRAVYPQVQRRRGFESAAASFRQPPLQKLPLLNHAARHPQLVELMLEV